LTTYNKIFTVLHLSDLHRNEDGEVKNDQLLTSLVLDSDNYTNPNFENIPRPNLIIISGDLIYGSRNPDDNLAFNEVREQYKEAISFLDMLAIEFFDGDKSKIIIVPGNHDVSWNISKKSMEKVDHILMSETEQKSYTKNISDPKTSIRWSWDELNFYKIKDEIIYNSRMELFSEFYENFYEGNRKYSLNPDEQFEIFEIPLYNLTVVGYNSCFRNDHMNHSGLINSKCLSASYNQIRKYQKKGRLLFATWHHNFSGIPSDDTYLDPRQLKSLNSYGFLIGFHGHQHHSDIVENYVQFDNSKKIIAISAGTLCSARSHLPTGYKRQYNLLRLDYIQKTCELYSRESIGNMEDIPIWDKGRINESMSSKFSLEINFPDRLSIPDITMNEIDSLTILLKDKNYSELLNLLKNISTENELVRSIIVEFDDNTNGKFRDEICQILVEPEQIRESIIFLDYYIEKRMKKEASIVLNNALAKLSDQPLLIAELNKYKKRIHGYSK